MFKYYRRIQFYETDLMQIVHHSNYLRFFEEARVSWAHSVGLIHYQKPESASLFAVLETRVKHLRPCTFGDEITIELEVMLEGVRVYFQYRMFARGEVVALGQTIHVPLNSDKKAIKIPKDMRDILKGEQWTETWL